MEISTRTQYSLDVPTRDDFVRHKTRTHLVLEEDEVLALFGALGIAFNSGSSLLTRDELKIIGDLTHVLGKVQVLNS